MICNLPCAEKKVPRKKVSCETSPLIKSFWKNSPGKKFPWKKVLGKKKSLKKRFFSDFVEMAAFLACSASVELHILNQCRVRMRRLFYYSLGNNSSYYSLCFSLFLSRGASKAKMVARLLILSIFFFQDIFFKTLFSTFFFVESFTLDASSFTKTKQTLCILVIKNTVCSKRSKLD